MEALIKESYLPTVALTSDEECQPLIDEIVKYDLSINDSGLKARLTPLSAYGEVDHTKLKEMDLKDLILSQRKDNPDYTRSFLKNLLSATFQPPYTANFETFGHPVAAIILVKESSDSVIGKFTELYQQTFKNLPKFMSTEFLRCFVCISEDSEESDEPQHYSDIVSQFGPHCYRSSAKELPQVIEDVLKNSVYPFLTNVIDNWQSTHQRTASSFGFGKLLKKLVQNSPLRPDHDVFWEVGRDMQPHVALIPAQRESYVNIDIQLRRLADIAFMLSNYELAFTTYDYLRKPFGNEQKWDFLGGVCEMASLSFALSGNQKSKSAMTYISPVVDAAMYTYFSRLSLPPYSLRCVLQVSGVLTEQRHQLLAAGLLSTTLIELDPIPLNGDKPAETAVLMDSIQTAFKTYGWERKARLWTKLSELEWGRTK